MDNEFDFENRMLGAEYQRGDENEENSLRPKRLEDYIGQDKAKELLQNGNRIFRGEEVIDNPPTMPKRRFGKWV